MRKIRDQTFVTHAIWALLALAIPVALVEGRWSLGFVALATLALSFVPVLAEQRLGIDLPVRFVAAIVIFTFATIFLGEEMDFYNRYWWWDIILHGGSAVGFGLIGFLFMFTLFNGDRYAAPAWAVAFMGFCFAVMIGAVWEIFEFSMDRIFGANMQKSGLLDTMGDLIVDCIGASIGAFAGFLFLKKRQLGGLTGILQEFVVKNRRFFRKLGR
ncbi:MAG: hypothetical protein JSR87_11655 [Proteobacteria bacterium]|nr:hypothetical protein [Pseudomonadota bacterium]MBS0572284.1 hypothetical protein [Pseudomonadota bacterium]